MKKLFLLFFAAFSIGAAAQEYAADTVAVHTVSTDSAVVKKVYSDLVVNPIALPLGSLNLSYEIIASQNSGIGLSGAFIFSDYVIKSDLNFLTTLYYRYYFG